MRTSLNYIVLNKIVGETPLEALSLWKNANPEYMETPATYAGRLDPMASGKLLILLGEECKNREQYTGLDKEYEIEVVLGLYTDTGDALGIPAKGPLSVFNTVPIKKALKSVRGTHTVPYPAFSSKTVSGKPLFTYALAGTLSNISVPTHAETIYSIQLLNVDSLPSKELHERIQAHLAHVPRSDEPSKELGADFRQDDIRAQWDKLLTETNNAAYTVLTLRVTCASGTYMRTLASRIGGGLGTSGFALSINRTKIGKYRTLGPLGFWSKKY